MGISLPLVCRQNSRGLSKHPYYRIWYQMMARCYREEHADYGWYGGRGVRVCRAWHDPRSFFRWLVRRGYAAGLQVDRRDNSRGYSPGNCRLVTSKINNRNRRSNRRLTAFGETKLLTEWAEDSRCVVSVNTFTLRLFRGWPVEAALQEPLRAGRKLHA